MMRVILIAQVNVIKDTTMHIMISAMFTIMMKRQINNYKVFNNQIQMDIMMKNMVSFARKNKIVHHK